MIQSKKDYIEYLQKDLEAQSVKPLNTIRSRLNRLLIAPNETLQFTKLLRKVEYYQNCKHSALSKMYHYYLQRRLHKKQVLLGFYINPNCFGPGLFISHPGTILVNPDAEIGANCFIHPCTAIGAGRGNQPPKIGNDVYIGVGAKIFGSITIADGIAIGANSVVNKSFTEENITIAGIPAKKISNRGSKDYLRE